MTYAAPALPADLAARRDRVRRFLSGPLLALALIVLIVALVALSLPLGLFGGAAFVLGLRWSGKPLRAWVHTGPLEWF